MSAPFSPASEDSTSGSSGPVCALCGSASRTSSVGVSSLDIGPVSLATPTCEPSWPTPRKHADRTGRESITREGHWSAPSLGQAVELAAGILPRELETIDDLKSPQARAMYESACPCRCHQSTSSAAGSPAKTSVWPARAPGSTGNARVFGANTRVSLANYDPATSSWRTSQLSLLEDSTGSSVTWPRSGMTRNGTAFPLVPLAPLTGGTGSGLLPTPRAQNGEQRNSQTWLRPTDQPQNLENAVARYPEPGMWPTPKASPSGPDYARVDREGSGGDDLATAVARTFKTPTSAPFSHGGSGGELHKKVAPSGGPLNPQWVAWLMGFPIDWTSLPPSETRSSRKSRNGSANS
jgi:hypothetical protein